MYSISLLLLLISTNSIFGDAIISYQKLRQKSSHNSYKRREGLQDQLQYHRIRSLELDIYKSKLTDGPNYGDWFVYHVPTFDTATTCHRLSDCLQELKAWSNANPSHEVVTVWVDIKDSSFGPSGHSYVQFDALINKYLDVYTPGDILNGAATLQQAVGASSSNWPTNADLRGKFIFVMTDNVDKYADTNTEANSRSAFRACTVDNKYQIDDYGYCIFFNQKCEGDQGDVCRDIYSNNYVSRCYDDDDVDSSGEWYSAVNDKVHHIATDQINFHDDSWSKTHNSFGWPFQAMDNTYVGSNKPIANVINIQVDSGDIWGKYDDFVFGYKLNSDSNRYYDWKVSINNANSHVDDYAKAGLMIRSNISSKNNGESSPYFAVLRCAEDKKLRVQWRSGYKDYSNEHSVTIDTPGVDDIDQEMFTFILLSVLYKGGDTYAYGYGSQNGHNWALIKHVKFSSIHLKYQGIAGSSHNDGGNADGTKIKHLFTDLKCNNQILDANDLTKLNVGNDVSYSTIRDGFF